MAAAGSPPDVVPSDQIVGAALRLARLWRRLAEHRTWRPVADVAAVRIPWSPWAGPRPPGMRQSMTGWQRQTGAIRVRR